MTRIRLSVAAFCLAALACNVLPPASAVLSIVPADTGSAELARAADVLTKRLSTAGIEGDVVVSGDGTRIEMELRDENDVDVATRLVTSIGNLQLVDVGDNAIPAGTRLADDVTPVLTGRDVASAALTLDQFGNPQVKVTFTPAAAQVLADFTRAAVGHSLAIAVDGEVLMAPRIQEPILAGEVVITDPSGTMEASLLLAALLNSGPLPAVLVVESVDIR